MVHALADAGALPNLHRLLEGGASGALAGFAPSQREMLWTSIATGCRPSRHGISTSVEVRPDTGGVQPIGHRSWRAPAFWDILARAGIRSAAIGWPATRRGAEWLAAVIDDSFALPGGRDFESWPLPPDCAPPALRSALRELRIHPADIAAPDVAAFVPDLAAVDQAADRRLVQIAHMLAEAATVQAAAMQLASDESWQMLAVHYRLLDHAQRGFQRFKAGTGADARRYGGVVDAAYRFQDMLIGGLLDACGGDTDVMIVSAGPRGALIAHGPSFARDGIVHDATVLDIAPTILALFGLESVADGRVVNDMLAAPVARLRPAPRIELSESPNDGDLVASLEALGYRDTLSPAQRQTIREAELASLLNLAESEIAFGTWREAAGLLRRVLALSPGHETAPLLLARCLVLLDEWEACRPIAVALLARDPESLWGHLLQGAIFAVAGDAARAAPHLAQARKRGASNALAQLQLGLLALRLGDAAAAEKHFRAVIARDPEVIEALHGLALACRAQGKTAAAEAFLRQVVAQRFHFPRAHYQLGLALADQGRIAEATHALRTALQQDPALEEAQQALRRLVQAQIALDRGGSTPPA